MKKKHLIWLFGLIIVASAFRLLQGLPFNFNPIGAVALFGAAYLPRKWMAYIIPVLAMWVGNIILNNTVYAEFFESAYIISEGMIYMTAAFCLIVFLALRLFKKVSVIRILVGAVGAGVIFYVVTNFGVWLSDGMYPMTAEGLFICYEAALPFFRNTIAGNLVFSAVLFGTYALATRQQIQWTAAKEKA